MNQRHLIGAAAGDMTVERVVTGVDHGTGEPAAIQTDAGIEYLFRGLDPVDLPRGVTPKALGISERAGMGLVIPAVVLDVHRVAPGDPSESSWRGLSGTSPTMTASGSLFAWLGCIVTRSGGSSR